MFDGNKRLAQLLRELSVRRKVDFVRLENLLVNESLVQIVDVIATKVRIAVGREDLIDVAFGGGNKFENGNVECSAAEIVDGDATALLFVETISECCGCWLIDQSQDLEASDFAGVLGSLALSVVEIRRNGDDRAVDGFAEESFGPALQFAQDERGNFRRSEHFVAEHDADDIFARSIDAEGK